MKRYFFHIFLCLVLFGRIDASNTAQDGVQTITPVPAKEQVSIPAELGSYPVLHAPPPDAEGNTENPIGRQPTRSGHCGESIATILVLLSIYVFVKRSKRDNVKL